MKRTAVIFVALALPLSFWLGRASAPGSDASDLASASELASVDSLQRALEDPDWLTRSYRFSAYLMGLTPENLPDTLEVPEPHLPWLLTDEFRMLMLAWSRFDPSGAFEHALTWPAQFRRNAGGAAMYAWGYRNPLEAVRTMGAIKNDESKEFWAARLLAGWAHGEFRESANSYIATFPEGPVRLAYLGTLAWEISKEGPEAVQSWAEAVPDYPPRFKQGVFLKATTTLAGIDAPSTAVWLRGYLDHDYADDALLVLAGSWAMSDAPAAMQWLSELPAGRKRDAAVLAGYKAWFRHARNDAERWLLSASPSLVANPAVRFMAERTRDQDRELSRKWAKRLMGRQ
jgi:hypothetical protein